MKRYALYYGAGKGGPQADGSTYWSQFPAVDKQDAEVQAQRIALHHGLEGPTYAKYVGVWRNKSVEKDQFV